MANDPELRAHQEWLGYVQPVGLVVSVPALAAAQAFVSRNIIPEHRRFLEWVEPKLVVGSPDPIPVVRDLPGMFAAVLGWEPADLVGGPGADPLPDSLEVALPEYGETLRPTYAVRDGDQAPGAEPRWMILIRSEPVGVDLDEKPEKGGHGWQASPQARFERLLRESQVPIGLLFNGISLRLVYAPRGETSGHLTFRVQDMVEVAGRPIFAALHLLLNADRLFTLEPRRRLPAILTESRKYQNVVSTQLAGQVLAALYELLRGLQAADDARNGDLLREVLRDDPDQVYAGLLTVLLRMVFGLYAEDRGLMSADEVYINHYSLTGLFERLRADAGRYPDTMDQRYGAWAQLIALFRLVHDGGRHGAFRIPPRHGYLFDPDRYPFLEGRAWRDRREHGGRIDPPRVPDGVVFRVLGNLLLLDGERLSYRTLDVEQIGSVYETMMGFHLEVARGRSIALKAKKAHGAPTTVDLDALLAVGPEGRAKWLKERADQEVTGEALKALKAAATPEDAVATLGRKVAREATPRPVAPGAMVLQPSDERRRSGSHYTPRSLTEPIVRTTLRPILERLGPTPTPAQVLDLKVCDPAMGSGAFLVESCRQLGDALVQAWHDHPKSGPAKIPPDEDELLHARRIVAQRCLYGVDKNPMAVDLAKLSLWLATLAKDHPFTFLDHALRHGDSLVGLTRKQIEGFHWKPEQQRTFFGAQIEQRIARAAAFRRNIGEAGDNERKTELTRTQDLQTAEEATNPLRFYADLVVAAFFAGANDKARKARLEAAAGALEAYLANPHLLNLREPLDAARLALREGERPVIPFHWEIEFPEVFNRGNPGFDAIVGNPPFAGKNTIIAGSPEGFIDWLKQIHEESHGNADLVAHFFRRCFAMLRSDGAFGLIATNTIGQGDTRSTGLRWIANHGGTIYEATRRTKWPGLAAVIVSVVHVAKGRCPGPFLLDGRSVPIITAYLFHAGGNNNPASLLSNKGKSSKGYDIYGLGFIFEDNNPATNCLDDMKRVIGENPKNAERIMPYIGGEEILNSPKMINSRFIINFEDLAEDVASLWREVFAIVENRVKPQRLLNNRESYRKYWWQYAERRPGLQVAICDKERVLVTARVGNAFAFDFIPSHWVMNEKVVVFAFERFSAFCSIQCRTHEIWARFFSATLKDDLQYALSDCFETFPFPENSEADPRLEEAGRVYYEFRADLMVRNDEGLTKTYNRFHDPDERSADIDRLRELHAAMDRAVLDAYGWTDLRPTCEFLLDYEEDDEGDEAEGGRRRRKKPYRYRWPDEFRDEVLARLLALNADRAALEKLAGADASAKKGRKPPRAKRDPNPPGLLPEGTAE